MRPTAESNDYHIKVAIDTAGETRLRWRSHDWPDKGDPNKRAWVRAGDIGISTRENPALLKRLMQMAEDGILEMRRGPDKFRVVQTDFTTRWRIKGAPRFRVLRPLK